MFFAQKMASGGGVGRVGVSPSLFVLLGPKREEEKEDEEGKCQGIYNGTSKSAGELAGEVNKKSGKSLPPV